MTTPITAEDYSAQIPALQVLMAIKWQYLSPEQYLQYRDSNQGVVVTDYGHSLADNNHHIFKKIGHGTIPYIYISLYGAPNSAGNKLIRRNATKLKAMRPQSKPLGITYFDAESARVWG